MPIHPPGTLDSLPPGAFVGLVDLETLPEQSADLTDEEARIARARASLPPPSAALNLRDIEVHYFVTGHYYPSLICFHRGSQNLF
jgi:L-lactate dehydrogenase (cytochrome)